MVCLLGVDLAADAHLHAEEGEDGGRPRLSICGRSSRHRGVHADCGSVRHRRRGSGLAVGGLCRGV